jgi:hypothetical protein
MSQLRRADYDNDDDESNDHDHHGDFRSSPTSSATARRHRRMLTAAAANAAANGGNNDSKINDPNDPNNNSAPSNNNNTNDNNPLADSLMTIANDEVTRSVDLSLRRYPRLLEQMRVADTLERRRRATAVARGHWQDTLRFVIEKTRGLIPRGKAKPRQVPYMEALTARTGDDDERSYNQPKTGHGIISGTSGSILSNTNAIMSRGSGDGSSGSGITIGSSSTSSSSSSAKRPMLKTEQFLLFGPDQETENWKRWTPEQWKQWYCKNITRCYYTSLLFTI